MLNIYLTEAQKLKEISDFKEGCWVNIIKPNMSEVERVANFYNIDKEDLLDSLDMDESSRLSIEDDYTLVLVDIPIVESTGKFENYSTIPLAIVMAKESVITICRDETNILNDFASSKFKDFSTKKQLRFIYQILLNNATYFQKSLRIIEKNRRMIEGYIAEKTNEEDLFALNELESSLVYFDTSLRADKIVLERLIRYKRSSFYSEDSDLVEDVTIEYQQAIEMTGIFRHVIDGTRELMSSVIDNRLNSVMKYLTSITLVMAIPTLISGLYGMNVDSRWIPLANTANGFAIICVFIFICCIVAIFVLKKRDML